LAKGLIARGLGTCNGRVEARASFIFKKQAKRYVASYIPDITFKTSNQDCLPMDLDETDWRIVKELQADGRMTNIALASRVGLSPPPCLRRVRALEEAGLISGYTALVDEAMLGYALTAFAMVRLHNQSELDLRAFENRILAWPLVREAYMLSGDSDFMLKCIARDLPDFQSFVLDELTAAPNVASVKTFMTIRRAKREPGIPIGAATPGEN
jgi:DNA-binding Lrp family transcriptional regulator